MKLYNLFPKVFVYDPVAALGLPKIVSRSDKSRAGSIRGLLLSEIHAARSDLNLSDRILKTRENETNR